MKQPISFTLVALLMALLVVTAAQAQDTPARHPLFDMLGLVPDSANTYAGFPWVGYGDFHAAEAAREGVPTFDSWAEWHAALDAGERAARLWVTNLQRAGYGWPSMFQYLMVSEDTEALIGFSQFDVDRALTFGVPPSQGLVLAGDFDRETIVAAHQARDYQVSEIDSATILAVGDEDAGRRMNVANRNPANPFGGSLGRSEPIGLQGEYLVNSPSLSVVESMLAAGAGTTRSLLDRPNFVAGAEAVTAGDALLISALFMNPLDVSYPLGDPVRELGLLQDPNAPRATPEPSPMERYGTLPGYNLAVLADRQDGDDQLAIIALVYGDEQLAAAAAQEVTDRLRTFQPMSRGGNTTQLDDVNGTLDPPEVFYSDSTGLYVALATVRYPTPPLQAVDMVTGEPVGDDFEGVVAYAPPGRLLQLWFSAIMQREFDLLAITP